jgi:ribonuclease T2
VNPRFSLALVGAVLIGGAVALWWSDRQQQATPPVQPISSAEEPVVVGPDSPTFYGEYVLTLSWHPAFCETKPNLPECRDERASDYSADHFSLHGLWPQVGEYCGVSDSVVAIDEVNHWDDLPEIDVSNATWRDLTRLMPGTEDSLERHEWVLHGTCSGASADTFFKRAIALVEEVNGSAVRDLLERNIGRQVSRTQLRAAFDDAFGDGAGRKVRLDCEEDNDRNLIFELRINLEGDAVGNTRFRDLIHAARNAGAGCNGGIVDRVGEQ